MNFDKCSGCRLCEFICPRHAITMSKSWFGFLYPSINKSICSNCKLCEKLCPTNNIKKTSIVKSFVGYNNNLETRIHSSSGGIFSELAKYAIKNNGIVFGAVFDKEFNVIIESTDNDYSKMLGSKYVQADVKNTYAECKAFLDSGRFVLYTGTPCQIYGLKTFLKSDYNNLLSVDIFCHGVPSPTIWQKYRKSFNKPIKSINFRDKKLSWENYCITIIFEDGSVFSEPFTKNIFMKQFLDNKILRKSCYACKFRNNSIADISIGDAWSISTSLNDHRGLSDLVVHTQTGLNYLEKLNITKRQLDYSTILNTNCIDREFTIPQKRNLLMTFSDKPKIAICTDHQHSNVGGALQAVALHDKVKELLPTSSIEFVNQWAHRKHTTYFDNNCKFVTTSANDSYTHLIVGSDQIWNKRFCNSIPFNDRFLINNIKNKIVYAASFGHHTLEYTKDELNKISESLRNVKYISTRELSGTLLTHSWFNIESKAVLDPTMLHDKEYYLNKIHQPECKNQNGIFAYILDNNNEWKISCQNLSKQLKEPLLQFDGSCEQFIFNFNKAKYIITDSYHGSVFSLIFNKPFICLRNKMRGNDRFDDLCIRFNIEDRFIESLNNINLELFNIKPNCNSKILEYRKDSLDFLTKALFDIE